MQNSLVEYLSSKIDLSENDKQLIADAYQLVKLKKKEHLFEAGTRHFVEAFIVQGTMRVYYVDSKGLEHVLYFGFKNWWVGDMALYRPDECGLLSAQALEDTTVLIIHPDKKEELFAKIPGLERFFRIIIQRHLAVLQKRFLLTVSTNAQERYEELLERSPGIEQLVPQHQIASYLGILPESLSRMKKQKLDKRPS